jgi:hypothetical protein
MNPDDFTEVVKDAIPKSALPGVWDALTDPEVIDRTRECLTAIRVDVQAQLAVANTTAESARARAIENGDEAGGREALHRARNDRADWRRRAMRYLRLVDQRAALVKSRAPRCTQSPPGTKSARAHNSGSLEKLARAVALHRSRVLSGEGSEDDDENLWECLTAVTAIAGGEELPLEKWLELIDEREDDE